MALPNSSPNVRRLRSFAFAALLLSLYGRGAASEFASPAMPPPPELLVPAGVTVIAAAAPGRLDEPAGNALLMWGVQPHETYLMQAASPRLFSTGTKETTSQDVASAATAIQNAIGRAAQIHAELAHTSWSTAFLGKITVTVPHPSAEEIGEILGAVQNVKIRGLDIQFVGTWYRPTSSCQTLATRSETEAFQTARSDVEALGASLGLRTKALLLKRARDAALPVDADPYLCTASIPRLPLSLYTAPRPVPTGRFVVNRLQIVAYSTRDTIPERAVFRAAPVVGVPEALSEAYVHLRLQSRTLRFSSIGTAIAHPALSAALLSARLYAKDAPALARKLRTDGFDALAITQPDGSTTIYILVHGASPANIDRAKSALQHVLLTEMQWSQIDAIQAVPFAMSCAPYRADALAVAARQARSNDEALATMAEKHLVRPVAIVEHSLIQDVVCGSTPQTTLEAVQRTDPLTAYTYNQEMFGFIQASVEAAYAAR